MSELSCRQRLISILDGNTLDRPACICPMSTAANVLVKDSGCSINEAMERPKAMARLALAANKVAGIESARVPFDDSVEASAFGVRTGRMKLERFTSAIEIKISSVEMIDELEVPDPAKAGRCHVITEAISLLDATNADVPILLGIISPISLAMQLRGERNVLGDLSTSPDSVKRLLGKLVDFQVEYARSAFEAGADVLVVDRPPFAGRDKGSGSAISLANHYTDLVCVRCRRFGLRTIMCLRGDTEMVIEASKGIGSDGILVDHIVRSPWSHGTERSSRKALVGNIDPARTLLIGGPGETSTSVRECIDEGFDVIAPAAALETYTPRENLIAMVETTKTYGLVIAAKRRR